MTPLSKVARPAFELDARGRRRVPFWAVLPQTATEGDGAKTRVRIYSFNTPGLAGFTGISLAVSWPVLLVDSIMTLARDGPAIFLFSSKGWDFWSGVRRVAFLNDIQGRSLVAFL